MESCVRGGGKVIWAGLDVGSGLPIEVEGGALVEAVRVGSVTDRYIAPGFIDVQVNGFGGVDYNSLDSGEEEILGSIEVIRATGVCRFYPTAITGPKEAMVAALGNLARVRHRAIDGFHVEGPHLSPEDGPRGAHPLESIRRPDVGEYRAWQEATGGRVRLVTVSPHWEGVTGYIEALVGDGVTVSIGHTHASGAQIADAVSAGASMSTHLGNAAHAVLPKQPNYIWEQLAEDRLRASFIVDGIHLQRAFVKSAIRAKGVGQCCLVTDASAPAGAVPGRYTLGAQAVDYTADGRVVLAGTDRLAGSALKMNEAVGNVMRMAGVSLADAVAMATGGRRGFRVGERADVVVFRLVDGVVQIISSSLSEP